MKKIVENTTIFQALEKWAPKRLAYDWDNVGLQIGSYNKPAQNIMITLDVLESVVDEAIEKEINLIIAHHPLFFKPLHQISMDTPKGRIIYKLIKHNITVYAAHTNLDIAEGGMNDILADQLGLHATKSIVKLGTNKLFKVIVYVPDTHMEVLRNSLSEAGAGHIGDYSHCSFQSTGKGTFKPLEGSTPFIGKENQLECVDEVKLETIVKEEDLSHVIQSMIKSHPYEEVAYDIFPLMNEGEAYGIGRVGLLSEEMSLQDLAAHIKTTFHLSHVRVTGDLSKTIRKVGILGGSGEKFINHAKQQGADVYITGDISFHSAQDAMEMGLSIIDVGHYIEKVIKKTTKEYLENTFTQTNLNFIVSETNTDPFQFI